MPYADPIEQKAYRRKYYLKHREQIKAKSARHRKTNKEHYREYFRAHYQKNRERIMERTRKYYSDNRETVIAVGERWKKENPKAHAAHHAVEHGLKRGDLERQPCEECGTEKVEAHHDDYEKPLEVQWLCRLHHRRLHSDLRLEAITAPEAVF